jgi:hypothetical protein
VVESTAVLNEPTGPPNQEAWFDSEYGRYVLEHRPLLALGEDGLDRVAQDQHLSTEPLDPTNQHNVEDTQHTLKEPGTDTLPHLFEEGGGQKCGENMSELERGMLLPFQDQEDLSAAAPSSRYSPELTHEQMCQESDLSGTNCGGLEEPRNSSRHDTQAEGGEPQETVAHAVKEVKDGGSKSEQAESVEKRLHQNECNGSSISDEDDEEDEEPRPAKRRKRDSQLTRQTPVEVEHHISQTSRSPSATRDPIPVAEYQEWPFQGFLKRTRIGTETTYNLVFKLPCVSKLLQLPIEACDDEDVPTTPTTCPKAPYSKASTRASRPRTRVGWKPEDDTRLVDMKNCGRSWKEIYAAFPDRTPGTIHVRCSTKLKSRLAKSDFNRPTANEVG